MESNQIRFIRNDSGTLILEINEGTGWSHYRGSELLKKGDWQSFKAERSVDKTIQETFIVIQFGLKHGYEILPAGSTD